MTSRQTARAQARSSRAGSRVAGRRPWRWGRLAIIAAGGVIVLAVAAIVFVSRPQDSTVFPAAGELARIQQAATHVPAEVFDAVGTGDLPNPIKPMQNSQALGGVDGKPELLYIG